MSSLNQNQTRKQLRCLPVTKDGSFRYVEIITSDDGTGNYKTELKMVDERELKDSWAAFYFRSERGACEQ